MIHILIADDHAIVRQGMKQILAATGDMHVSGEAASGVEALEKMRAQHYDIVLVDISMPGMNGIDLVKRVKSEKPKLPVLVLSMHKEEQFALRALRAGASGYLTKESAPDLLVGAIRKAAAGGKYISAELAEKLANALDPFAETSPIEALSDREYQVLRLIVSGRSLSEIAAELSLSIKTVSTHKVRIMKKLGVSTNVELIHHALQFGLADTDARS